MSSLFQKIFGIDTRALAFLRIGLGSLILIDLIARAVDLTAFYTDDGLLPREDLLDLYLRPYHFSFHLFGGSSFFVSLLFLLAGFLAIAMIVGYKTRWATILSFLLLVSLHNRNPIILNGGDTLLRVLVFWSIFLPLNARYSVDRWLNKGVPNIPNPHWSMGTIGLMAQVAFVYFFSALLKTGDTWQDGTAVFYALSLDLNSTSFAGWLLEYPAMTKLATHATFYLEKFGWLLLFLPFWKGRFRTASVVLFAGLHASFLLTLKIGLFPIVAIIMWLALLPTPVWDWLEKRLDATAAWKSIRQHTNQLLTRVASRNWIQAGSSAVRLGFAGQSIAAVMLVSITMWNLMTIDAYSPPDLFKSITRYPRMTQQWSMFAPNPNRLDGWFVTSAHFSGGVEKDLFNGTDEVSYEKPRVVSSQFSNNRWRKYMKNLSRKKYRKYRSLYGSYYCHCYNDDRKADEPELQTLSLYFMQERTQPPGEPLEIKKRTLWNHWCKKKYKKRFAKEEEEQEEPAASNQKELAEGVNASEETE